MPKLAAFISSTVVLPTSGSRLAVLVAAAARAADPHVHGAVRDVADRPAPVVPRRIVERQLVMHLARRPVVVGDRRDLGDRVGRLAAQRVVPRHVRARVQVPRRAQVAVRRVRRVVVAFRQLLVRPAPLRHGCARPCRYGRTSPSGRARRPRRCARIRARRTCGAPRPRRACSPSTAARSPRRRPGASARTRTTWRCAASRGPSRVEMVDAPRARRS